MAPISLCLPVSEQQRRDKAKGSMQKWLGTAKMINNQRE
jgi:hypothetical protein